MNTSSIIPRTTRTQVEFRKPFRLPGISEPQPAGSYSVEFDEQPVEELSFLAYRRTAAWIDLTDPSAPLGSSERVWVDPQALDAALKRDAAD